MLINVRRCGLIERGEAALWPDDHVEAAMWPGDHAAAALWPDNAEAALWPDRAETALWPDMLIDDRRCGLERGAFMAVCLLTLGAVA